MLVKLWLCVLWCAGAASADDRLLARDAALANLSADPELAKYEDWMNAVYKNYWTLKPEPRGSFSEDVFLLLITIVLPGALFCAFFLFVTFCTGTPVKAPYSNVDEPAIITPWTLYPQKNICSPKGIKCYPTYGQV